jgi:hypothetical protein
MPTLTIHYATDAERLAYERAIAFVAEMHRLGLQAPDRDVINACEGLALDQGRKLLQDTLAAAVQARVDDLEKKPPPQPLAAGTKDDGRARS